MIAGLVQMLRNSGDKALIIRKTVTHDDHTLGGDFIFTDIFAVVATAHLDDNHDLAKLAVDTYVPKPDNVIGEKGDRVGTEREFRERLIHLNGAQNRHSDSGQSSYHAVERFAKVRAEAGGKRHLKAPQ